MTTKLIASAVVLLACAFFGVQTAQAGEACGDFTTAGASEGCGASATGSRWINVRAPQDRATVKLNVRDQGICPRRPR